ncbi:MAG: 3-phosphoshikimate 1-carboxyvinyltransferase [Clostridiales bacterium]|nr:3-phosphoshikimate 1-carboxyvinyltransferase [Clostridiales bacterium]
MQKVVLSPSRLKGSVNVPPSKSIAHRAIISACLARGKSRIFNADFSQDILATIDAVKALGARVETEKNEIIIDATDMFSVENAVINCRESGSTLRFMLSVAAVGGGNTTFNGEGRLPKRTIAELLKLFESHSVKSSVKDGLPVTISGKLTGGLFEISGDISSQFITGLMFALPLCSEDSTIKLTTKLESKGYIDITISVLADFGIEIQPTNDGWFIRGNQTYKPNDYTIEADWSQAAFYMGAGLIGSELRLKGLNKNSSQGDMAGLEVFRRFGADISWDGDVLLCKPSKRKGIEVDAKQIPDLVPIIAACSALCEGKTVIYGAKRLKLKESDRLFSMADGLQKLGVDAQQTDDGIIIYGAEKIKSADIKGYNDHRIVMAFSVLSLCAEGEVTIDDAQSINKSYPDFFNDYNSLGGKADVINLG